MTKEKLIELLEGIDGESGFRLLGHHDSRRIADCLIANGVKVQPVPDGCTVFAFYDRSVRRNGRSRCSRIDTIYNLKRAKYFGYPIEIREKKATKQDIQLLGKLAFLSREEAEHKLIDTVCVLKGSRLKLITINKTEV